MTRCRAVIGPPAPRRPHHLSGVAVGGAPVVVDGSIPRLVVPEADTSAMIDIDSVQNGEYTTIRDLLDLPAVWLNGWQISLKSLISEDSVDKCSNLVTIIKEP